MAQYTPKNWQASSKACQEFNASYHDIARVVHQKARKYFALASITNADLIQEGMIAALYAVDSFDATRGFKREAYIARLVDNALMMVVAESRSQCRQPYMWVRSDEPKPEAESEWRRIPVSEFVEPDEVTVTHKLPVEASADELERIDRAEAARARLSEVRKNLSPTAKMVFDARTEPPQALFVIARNLSGRNVGENGRMPNAAIAAYLNLAVTQVVKALTEVRKAVEARYSQRVRKEIGR